MFRRRERSEEIADLMYDALQAGLEHAVLSAQRNDRDAQAFMAEYKEFYLNGKRPSESLSVKAGTYVSRALSIDTACLHAAGYRWSFGLTALFGTAASAFALTKNWWYAAGAAVGSGISYLSFLFTKKMSANDAARVQTAIAFKKDAFRDFLQESKEYMGEELWAYGSLSDEQLLGVAKPKQRRYRRSKV
jgi:hypothetical protein